MNHGSEGQDSLIEHTVKVVEEVEGTVEEMEEAEGIHQQQ